MTTAFNLVDYRAIKPVRRLRLRIVAPVAVPRTSVEPAKVIVAAEVAPVPAATPTPHRKPMPPSWMVAPPFCVEPVNRVTEPQAAYHPAPAESGDGPYRTIREVPRADR